MERLYFRGGQQQAPVPMARQLNMRASTTRVCEAKTREPMQQTKPDNYKNVKSSEMKNCSDDEGCCGMTFDEIINEKPKPEVVAEFIQSYINKIVKEDESETSDFESSEYNTDR
jgi:hypothetical protein